MFIKVGDKVRIYDGGRPDDRDSFDPGVVQSTENGVTVNMGDWEEWFPDVSVFRLRTLYYEGGEVWEVSQRGLKIKDFRTWRRRRTSSFD